MTVEEAIKMSGTKNILAQGSTKKAQQMIDKDEDVLYAINTNVILEDNRNTLLKSNNNTSLFSVKNALNGVLVITNKRVIFCSSIIGNTKQKQISIKDITSIDKNINGLTKMGQLRIRGITESFIINVYKEKTAIEIENSICEAQNTIGNSNITQAISNADEIMKYKKLLDEGIISQEEFERKKQELLR